MNKKLIKSWIEAMRLRTLPVSIAGVLAGTGCAIVNGGVNFLPFVICLFFALFAQIVSNFANEYFDFKNGLDKKGRDGFRRGVTEGDISPRAMLLATLGLLAFDCLIGLSLTLWGGWWLIIVGVAIAIFALAYSAGPYPLSHHGLGEVAVIFFFGLVPVIFTNYVQTGNWNNFYTLTLPVALAVGLMAANVLIVNNYRDADDDKAVGKHTTAVIFGRKKMFYVYFLNGFIAAILVAFAAIAVVNIEIPWLVFILAYANIHYKLWRKIGISKGSELNPLLGKTSILMFLFALWILIAFAL